MGVQKFQDRFAEARKSKLLAELAIAFFLRFLGALSQFGVALVIVRAVGSQESGYYFLAFSLVMLLSALCRAGLDNTIVRLVSSEPASSSSLIFKAYALVLGLSLICATSLFLSAGVIASKVFNKPELSSVFQMISVGIVGLSMLTVTASALQGLRRFFASIFTLNIGTNLCLIGAVYIFTTDNAASLATYFSAATVLVTLFGMMLLWLTSPDQSVGGVSWHVIGASCAPLWVVVVMDQAALWAGQLIAGAYVQVEQVAQLAVAQRIALLVSFILIALNVIIAPRFAALYKNGQLVELEKLALLAVRLIAVISVPIIGVMLFFPKEMMALFGQSFVKGASFLQVLALGQFFNAITGPVAYLLMMSGHERDMRNITLVSGSCAIVLTWGLTAQFGAVGAASGTAIAVASQNLLAVYFVKKRLGFNTLAVWRSTANLDGPKVR